MLSLKCDCKNRCREATYLCSISPLSASLGVAYVQAEPIDVLGQRQGRLLNPSDQARVISKPLWLKDACRWW